MSTSKKIIFFIIRWGNVQIQSHGGLGAGRKELCSSGWLWSRCPFYYWGCCCSFLFKFAAFCLAGEALLAGEKLLDVVKICLKMLSGCGEKLVVVVQTVVHALFLFFHTSCFCTYPRAHASFLCTAISVV
jgi:hypothetical protein